MGRFEKTETQLDGMFDEMSLLSKKKPDGAINKFKLRFINQVLHSTNEILGDEHKPFPDFDEFSEDELPTASDVVMMLSQYQRGMDQFRVVHTRIDDYGQWYWVVEGASEEEFPAEAPKRLSR